MVMLPLLSLPVFCADWPQYRYDSGRRAATDESLPADLHLLWKRELLAPSPCYKQDVRLHFDLSYEPVVMGKKIFIPSMVNDSVTAFNTETGSFIWRFITAGPVRLAPVAWKNKVYFVSDDGYLYCVSASDGSLIWKFRGKPGKKPVRKILANGRLTSAIPSRGGPVLKDGVIYFATGIWPDEGVYVHALKANSGKVIWSATDISKIAGANWEHQWTDKVTGIAAQGHLAIVGNQLVVPCGSQLPALFAIKNGARKHYTTGWAGRGGLPKGTFFVNGIGKYLFCGGDMYDITMKSYFDGVDIKSQYSYLAGLARLRIDPNNRETMGDFLMPILTKDTMYTRDPIDGFIAYDISKASIVNRTPSSIPVYRRKDWPYGNKKLMDKKKNLFRVRWRLAGTPRKNVATANYVDRNNYCSYYEKLINAKENTLRIYLKAGKRLYCGMKNLVKAYNLQDSEKPPLSGWQRTIKGTPNSMLVADGKLFVVTKEGSIYAFGKNKVSKPPLYAKPTFNVPPSDKWTKKAASILQSIGISEGYVIMLGIGSGRLAEEIVRQSGCNVIAIESNKSKIISLRTDLCKKGLYGTRISIYYGNPEKYQDLPYIANFIISENWRNFKINKTFIRKIYRLLRPYGGVICMEPRNIKNAEHIANSAKLPNALIQKKGAYLTVIRSGALPGSADWSHKAANAANTWASKDNLNLPVLRLWTDSSMGWSRQGGVSVRIAGGRVFMRDAVYKSGIVAYDAYTGRFMWQTQNIRPNPLGEWVAMPDAIYFAAGSACVILDSKTGRQLRKITLPPEIKGNLMYIRVIGNTLIASTKEDEVLCFDIPSGKLHWKYVRSSNAGNMAIGDNKVFCSSSMGTDGEALNIKNGKLLWKFKPGGTFLAYNHRRKLLVTSKQILDASGGSFKAALPSKETPLAMNNNNIICGINGDAMHIKVHPIDKLLAGKSEAAKFEARWQGCSFAVYSQNVISTRDANAIAVDMHTGKRQDFYNTRYACTSGGYVADCLINNPNKQGGCACNYTPVSTAYVSVAAFYGKLPHVPKSAKFAKSVYVADKSSKSTQKLQSGLKNNDIIVFIGDSITYQGTIYDYGYVRQIQKRVKKAYLNANIKVIGSGINGRDSRGCDTRFDLEVIKKNATIAVIYIGINDVWHSSTTKEKYRVYLNKMIAKAKAAGIRTIICTPSIIGELKRKKNKYDKTLDEYATVARDVARKTNTQLIDFRKLFVNYMKKHNSKNVDRGILTQDGVHPNKNGHSFIAENMWQALGAPSLKTINNRAPEPIKTSLPEKTIAPDKKQVDKTKFGALKPKVTNISGVYPVPGATGVNPSIREIKIKFTALYNNKYLGNKYIKILKSSDKSLVENINVLDLTLIDYSNASDTLTISLTKPLKENTKYYVITDDKFVKVNKKPTFRAGAIPKGVWNFTTGKHGRKNNGE